MLVLLNVVVPPLPGSVIKVDTGLLMGQRK